MGVANRMVLSKSSEDSSVYNFLGSEVVRRRVLRGRGNGQNRTIAEEVLFGIEL